MIFRVRLNTLRRFPANLTPHSSREIREISRLKIKNQWPELMPKDVLGDVNTQA